MVDIPVFVSCPSTLNVDQERLRDFVLKKLKARDLQPRTVGRSDYPTEAPLREVAVLIQHCAGGLVLGFTQTIVEKGVRLPGTTEEERIGSGDQVHLPTPWNHLEAGLLYGGKLPLLILREVGVDGGIFDPGTTDRFIHGIPKLPPSELDKERIEKVIEKWQAQVRERYYRRD